MFLKQSLIDERFPIPLCFIISNSDSDQFEFSYLTKLLSAFNRNSSLDAFHDQVLDEEVPRWTHQYLFCFTDNPSVRFTF